MAAELPAIAMGTQWPMPKSKIKRIPVKTFCWIVIRARIGAIKPKVQDPERMP